MSFFFWIRRIVNFEDCLKERHGGGNGPRQLESKYGRNSWIIFHIWIRNCDRTTVKKMYIHLFLFRSQQVRGKNCSQLWPFLSYSSREKNWKAIVRGCARQMRGTETAPSSSMFSLSASSPTTYIPTPDPHHQPHHHHHFLAHAPSSIYLYYYTPPIPLSHRLVTTHTTTTTTSLSSSTHDSPPPHTSTLTYHHATSHHTTHYHYHNTSSHHHYHITNHQPQYTISFHSITNHPTPTPPLLHFHTPSQPHHATTTLHITINPSYSLPLHPTAPPPPHHSPQNWSPPLHCISTRGLWFSIHLGCGYSFNTFAADDGSGAGP